MSLKSLILSAAAAAALASGAAAQNLYDDVLDLTLALGVIDANFNPTTNSVLKLADTWGYYERHGLNVEIIALDGTPQAAAALNSGAVDMADISIDVAIRLRAENDVPVRGIVATGIGNNFLIAAREDIRTLEDLAGRSYAIADNGSLDHQLTQAVLRSFGMPADAPDFVAIGAPDVRIQALAAGRIDATTVSFATYSSIEGTEGIHMLMDWNEFSQHGPALGKFIGVLDSTIAEKEEALQRFTDAVIELSRDIAADPHRWIEEAAAARPDLSRENIETTAQLLASRWCINGCMSAGAVASSVSFVYANPEFAAIPAIPGEDMVDLRFTERALERMGALGGDGLDARN